MPRHSEFNASHSLATDAQQRRELARRDALAVAAMRRLTVTRNDRRRAAVSGMARLACLSVAVFVAVVVAAVVVGGVL